MDTHKTILIVQWKKMKKKIVINFIKKNNFSMLADLGCNDGEYSRLALENGSMGVIGFDFDINSIDRAF